MAGSAEAMANKFLADLIKSREQATSQAVSSAIAASAPPPASAAPIKPPVAHAGSMNGGGTLSQQMASALQAKSNATDELMHLMDTPNMDMQRVSVLKQTIQDLNVQLKQLEAQGAVAQTPNPTGRFADDRVMPAANRAGSPPPAYPPAHEMPPPPLPDDNSLVDISPATFSGKHQTGPPPGYKTRKQREAEEAERIRVEEERVKQEGNIKFEQGKHMKGDMVLSDTTLYVEPNWHTSVAAGPTLECDPLCRSPLESVVVELLKHVQPGEVGRVGLTPDSSSPRAYIHFLQPEQANRLLSLLTPNSNKLLCRVGTHEFRLMRAKPKNGQDYALRPPCNQIWVRGTVLSDEKLLQNLSRFGNILGHTRSSREVTVTFENDESALKAIQTLPTERQWWGAYINFAQQAQLVSLKNGRGGGDFMDVKLEAKQEGDGGFDDGRYFGGPRRQRRKARHGGPLMGMGMGRERSPTTPMGDGPMQWPEFDIKPTKEEMWESNYPPFDHHGPPMPRREPLPPQDAQFNGGGGQDWGRPAPPDFRHDPYGGPPPGHYPPDPYYDQQQHFDRRDGFNGYNGPPPPQHDFYNGPPPMHDGRGPPPMHDPYYQGSPPGPGYRDGPYPPPQHFNGNGNFPPPPHHDRFGPGPPHHYDGPPNGQFDRGPPPGMMTGPMRGGLTHRGGHRGNGRMQLPNRPDMGDQKPSSASLQQAAPSSLPPRPQQQQQQPPEEPVFRVKPEPGLEDEQALAAPPRAAQPAPPSGGKKAPIDFFRSSLDESGPGERSSNQSGSAWGSGGSWGAR